MFEKEARERFVKSYPEFCYNGKLLSPYWDLWQDGAEFGYNKANEWYKPSEKLPEEGSLVFAYVLDETEPAICEYVTSNQWECLPRRIIFCSNDQVRKWKEIVLPKESDE